MSSDDVLANEAECIDSMDCTSTVALSDGKYSGPCMSSELSFGDYIGCNDIDEIMVMTDDGRITENYSLRAPCPDF